jgi:hypothetical protein
MLLSPPTKPLRIGQLFLPRQKRAFCVPVGFTMTIPSGHCAAADVPISEYRRSGGIPVFPMEGLEVAGEWKHCERFQQSP